MSYWEWIEFFVGVMAFNSCVVACCAVQRMRYFSDKEARAYLARKK